VGEVESLKGLVDEFSQFARMPAPRTTPTDLHALIDSALSLYDGIFTDVDIVKQFGADVPLVRIDSEQRSLTPSSAPRPMPAARTVHIESQPSGAVVSIDGHVMGVTPLSTLLPAGTVVLSLTKVGYCEAQQVLQADAAGPELPPISVRTALRRAVAERSARARALERQVESALLGKPRGVAPRRAAQPRSGRSWA